MTSTSPLISVIVPIYRVEKYLHECVDSILNQTLENIEVILVDDGSPDSCPKICDDYAERDSRVRVIHQPNGGYGVACNTGIAAAKGDYIGIIESDDWIEPDMYEKLYKSAIKYDSDFVKCSFYHYNSQNKIKSVPHKQIDPRADIENAVPNDRCFTFEEYPTILAFQCSIWAGLYKTSLVKTIKLVESASASYQDFPFMVEVLLKAKRISAVHDCLVHYRNEPGNNSSSVRTDKKVMMVVDQSRIGYELAKKYKLTNGMKETLYVAIAGPCHWFYGNCDMRWKKEFFTKLHLLFNELDLNGVTLTYFPYHCKEFFNAVLEGRYKDTLVINKKIKFLSMTVYSEYRNMNECKIKFLSVPIYRKKIRNEKLKTKILGIPVATKKLV